MVAASFSSLLLTEEERRKSTAYRCLAASSAAHVFLEAVAVRANQSPGAAQTGDGQENGDPHRAESQRSMASVPDARDADRDDQSMAFGNPRPRLDSRPLDLTSLSNLNRLVRTRMLGGVGAGEGDLPGYPIRCLRCLLLSEETPSDPIVQPQVWSTEHMVGNPGLILSNQRHGLSTAGFGFWP